MIKLPSHFYAIIDPLAGHEPLELARILLDAGARLLQLRLKQATAREFLHAADPIAKLCHQAGALLIINDRPDIAILAGADGVHLGQDDLPVRAGRALLGAGSIVGQSTASAQQAERAERDGADYIGFGPLYPGGARKTEVGQGLERLAEVRRAVKIPIVAIGGITEQTVPQVLAAGADAAAIITDVVRAPDIAAKVRAILSIRIPRKA